MNYSSEIWGFEDWAKVETLHLKACKYAFGVRSSTTTDAVYAELGRVSLQCQRHINIPIFFPQRSSLESTRYASKAFCMLRMDADYGHHNWVSYDRDLRVRHDIQQSDTHSDFKNKIINHFQTEVLHRLNEHITDNKKLNSYASFKTNNKFESYLDDITNFTIRSTLAKLRLDAYNLHIETGRFSRNRTARDERFCPFCKTLNIFTVANEVHFLLSCSILNEEQQKFLEQVCRNFPNTALLSKFNLFVWLMTQEDSLTTKLLGNFCKTSFDKRLKFLSDPCNTID